MALFLICWKNSVACAINIERLLVLLLLLINKCITLRFIKNKYKVASFTRADVRAKFVSKEMNVY